MQLKLIMAPALSLLLAACSVAAPKQVAPDPKLPAPDGDNEYQVIFPEEGPYATRTLHAAVGEDLATSCGLMRAHFQFDSSQPLAEDALALKSLVDCINKPELKDKPLTLIGRADVRGSGQYNVALGRRRAESIKQVLIGAGVDGNRISIATRGAKDAVGDQKLFSYGYDRRVDVVLVGTPHAPEGYADKPGY